jgi:hypothetical protein
MNHRIGTHWHPQRCMVITSKVVIAIGFFAAAETASSDVGSHQTFETLTGECNKVMLMDVLTDPAVCSDQVTAIRSSDGTLGYAFAIDSQGWVIATPSITSTSRRTPEPTGRSGARTCQLAGSEARKSSSNAFVCAASSIWGKCPASEMISIRTDGMPLRTISRYGVVCPFVIDLRSRFSLL